MLKLDFAQIFVGRPKGEKGTKRKAAKDPNKPKRATTAYFYFLAAERELAKKEGRETNKVIVNL